MSYKTPSSTFFYKLYLFQQVVFDISVSLTIFLFETSAEIKLLNINLHFS